MKANPASLQQAQGSADPGAYRAEPLRLSSEEDRRRFDDLLRAHPGLLVHDTILIQLRDLIRTRQPARKVPAPELDALVHEHLEGSPADEYGSWFYYPWSMRLVHLLPELEFIELRTNRNRYKITPDEQAALARKEVGVVGLSVGQSVAVTLAMERSFGELRLADFDRLDLSNLNRIRAGVHELDVPKVYLTAREIAEIDPYLHVICFSEGITEANCDTFLAGGSPLDVLVEECDSLDIKILLREHARAHRIPVVMDTSDRGMIDVERFDLEPHRPLFHGLVGDLAPSSLRGLSNEQKIPYVLKILGVDHLSNRLRASLIEIEQTISTWPQLASAVAHGGAAAADVVRRICLGDPIASGRYYADLHELIPGEGTGQTALVDSGDHSPSTKSLGPTELLAAARAVPNGNTSNRCVLAPDLIRRFVDDAVQAPSGGNCQPWKWLADRDQIYLFHDRSRARTPFDPECLGGMVALGAASENLILSAHAAGFHVACEELPEKRKADLVASFRFSAEPQPDAAERWRDELYPMIRVRRTNRKVPVRQPLRPGELAPLTAAVESIPGVSVHWLLKEKDLDECGRLLGIGDRLLFLTESLHAFLVKEIRWTPQEAELTRDGISLESLDLSPGDRAGFELCRDWNTLELVRRFGGGAGLEKASRDAIAGASAVGLVTVPRRTPAAFFSAGRAVQRLWLTSAEQRLAFHPMTGFIYMLSARRAGELPTLGTAADRALDDLHYGYESLFSLAQDETAAFLFRLSYADETHHRSLRRPLDDVLHIVSVASEVA